MGQTPWFRFREEYNSRRSVRDPPLLTDPIRCRALCAAIWRSTKQVVLVELGLLELIETSHVNCCLPRSSSVVHKQCSSISVDAWQSVLSLDVIDAFVSRSVLTAFSNHIIGRYFVCWQGKINVFLMATRSSWVWLSSSSSSRIYSTPFALNASCQIEELHPMTTTTRAKKWCQLVAHGCPQVVVRHRSLSGHFS